MKVDWFTVIAQLINFLILVWLLNKLLYKPVLSAIEDREKKIKDRMNAAENKEADAEKEQQLFKGKNEEFERHKSELLEKVEDEVKTEKTRLLNEVREDAGMLRDKLYRNINEEREKSVDEFINKIEKEVFSISEKVLGDLSTVSLQDQIVDVFILRLNNLSNEEKNNFLIPFEVSDDMASIRSSFELSSSHKEKLVNLINELFQIKHLDFMVTSELIGGIELIVKGYKIGWNIRNYMQGLKGFVSVNDSKSVTLYKEP